MRITWPAKDPDEVLVAAFDFTTEVNTGETISAAIVDCSVVSGVDANPSAVLTGAAVVSAGVVLQPFGGGLEGVNYALRCEATLTPTNRVLVLAANLPVRGA